MQVYEEILRDARELARLAGAQHLKYWRQAGLQVQEKGCAADIVTAADKAAEREVKEFLNRHYPDHDVLTEESGASVHGSPWRWVIDPLDGTTNFNCGLPHFNVAIGVEHQGVTVAGVVYAAALGEEFTAVKGGGAWLNGQPISPSQVTEMGRAVVATGFPYDKDRNPDNNLREVSRVVPHVRGLRRLGSAALDICYVAAGFLDGYWEMGLHEWDVCAASLIAAEAGAHVERFRPDRGISLMAATPGIADELMRLIKGE